MGSYPLPKYHFVVNWGGSQTGFAEVTGLSLEYEVVEYREGASPEQHKIKMPGLQKFSNIILKRAVLQADNELYNWIASINLNQVERRDLVISLLNENHEPVLSWKVVRAWPCKYSVSDLRADSNEVLMETVELAHEGLFLVA